MNAAKAQREPLSATFAPLLWYLTPIVFFVWLYSDGLRTWFVADDFAWLALLRGVSGVHDLIRALFVPDAQGTFRFLSERAYFLTFEYLFGLNSLPFRICAFATIAADTILIAWITRRITGSRLAGLLAPILWTSSATLAAVMSWNSAYNEALCPLFLLGELALFVRFAETGCWAFWWWQLVVFILGFGSLETNAVYPAVAAAYVLFAGPKEKCHTLLRSLVPLFFISVAYFFLHRAIAPFQKEGPYALRFDSGIFQIFATYFRWSLVPLNWFDPGHRYKIAPAVFWLCALALAGFFLREITKKRYFNLFFLSWYLAAMAPMLLLSNHQMDYYLAIPLIGLAMLGALAIARVAEMSWYLRMPAAVLLTIWLTGMLPGARLGAHFWLERSRPVKALVLGVKAAQKNHPGKTIVLDRLSPALYESALVHYPFTAFGLNDVYLTPECGQAIQSEQDPERHRNLVLEPAVLRNAVTHREVVIYSFFGDRLLDSTEAYERSARSRPSHPFPHRVEVGSPLFSWLLGPEWLPLESGFRWMPRHATVRLAGPESPEDTLLLEGFCPDKQLLRGAVHLYVTVDGIRLTETRINQPESTFRRRFVLPPALLGRQIVEVAIAVNRVLDSSDGIDRGLVFGTIAILP
jgi:hypothetical protein